MITISRRPTETCMVVQVQGKITGDEYDVFADAIEDAIEQHGEIDLVIELLEGVGYGDFDAVKEDWEFTREEYKKVRRAAFVGDHRFLKRFVKMFAHFTPTEEGFFAADELDAAIEWACASD